MNSAMEPGSIPEPNTDLLRFDGWSIISSFGLYCTAWKGNIERLFVWQNGHWQHVSSASVQGA